MGSSTGAAATEPATLIAEAFMRPGAASIWFAPKHPSGNPKLYGGDLRLEKTAP